MLGDIWGGWTAGRIGRWRFLMLYVLLVLTVMAAMALLLGGAYVTGEIAPDPEQLARTVGLPVLLLVMLVMLACGIGVLNLIGKRGRDAGLPGWVPIVGFLVLAVLVRGMGMTGNMLIFAFIAVMAWLPTDQFRRGAPPAPPEA